MPFRSYITRSGSTYLVDHDAELVVLPGKEAMPFKSCEMLRNGSLVIRAAGKRITTSTVMTIDGAPNLRPGMAAFFDEVLEHINEGNRVVRKD